MKYEERQIRCRRVKEKEVTLAPYWKWSCHELASKKELPRKYFFLLFIFFI